jgi:predicted nucleic acid-binding Zn ribbon protein
VDVNPPENRKSAETVQPSTDDRGQPVDNMPEGPDSAADLVHNALADARGIARRTGRRADRERAKRVRRENLAGRRPDGYSGPGPDPDRDPQPIGSVFAGYAAERAWERPLAEARVFADWAGLVGAEVAAHCMPQSLNAGELRIGAESTAWATQLRLLSSTLLARLVAELGPEVVTRLVVTGPTGPSWKHGGRSVRGARGPRDTYG